MEQCTPKIPKLDWEIIAETMHENGFALVPNVLTEAHCEKLKNGYSKPALYRKTVTMERYRFGLGEYKYFDYPLPEMIQNLRESLYRNLAPIANAWMKALKIDKVFPENHEVLLRQCHKYGQKKPTPLLLKYGQGGYNTLHQDLYGEVYFPIQAALFLDEPDQDYTGGEFVMTEQRPRAQSKAVVMRPKKSDMLLFTTNFRPKKGKRGYYRVKLKHGVSEIHSGGRHTLGVIFHDAVS